MKLWVDRGAVGRDEAVVRRGQRGGGGKRGGGWQRGGSGGQREAVTGRRSDRIEGAKQPFGCKRSEPSCSGSGFAERSATERDPTSS